MERLVARAIKPSAGVSPIDLSIKPLFAPTNSNCFGKIFKGIFNRTQYTVDEHFVIFETLGEHFVRKYLHNLKWLIYTLHKCL